MSDTNYISKVKIGSSYYQIKDAEARSILAAGVSFIIAWDGVSTPVVANIPAGVEVTYNDVPYTGTLDARTIENRSFYLVKSTSQSGDSINVYNEYIVVGTGDGRKWELIGDTKLSLQGLGDLATRNTVTLNKGDGDVVLGEGTTFALHENPSLSFGNHTTKNALGSSTTFATTVTPATKKYKLTATGTAVTTADDTFVKSYPGSTQKLVTTSIKDITNVASVTIPNVTSAGSASTWSFAMGTGDDAETLIISGANGSAPTLGTSLTASNVTVGANDVTVATGSVAANGSGSDVLVGLGTATTGSALTSASVTTQPSVSFTEDNSNGTTFVTGITSAATSVDTADTVSAITGLGTPTITKPTIDVGTSDKITIAKYSDLSVSVS